MKSARIVFVLMFFVLVSTSFSQPKWIAKNGYWESGDTLVGTPIQAVADPVDSTKYWVLSYRAINSTKFFYLSHLNCNTGANQNITSFDSTNYSRLEVVRLSIDGKSLVIKGILKQSKEQDTSFVYIYNLEQRQIIKESKLHAIVERIDYNSSTMKLVWSYIKMSYPRGNVGNFALDGALFTSDFKDSIKNAKQIDNQAVSYFYNENSQLIYNSMFFWSRFKSNEGDAGNLMKVVNSNGESKTLKLLNRSDGYNEVYFISSLLRNEKKNVVALVRPDTIYRFENLNNFEDSTKITIKNTNRQSTISTDGEFLISVGANEIWTVKLSFPYTLEKESIEVDLTNGVLINHLKSDSVYVLNKNGLLLKIALTVPLSTVKSDFQVSDIKPHVGDTVVFNPLVTSTQAKLKWYFGDGATSTVYRPKHFYKDTGSYTVSLVSTTSKGEEQIIKKNFVRVVGKYIPLEVDFEVSRSIGNPGMEVQFTPKTRGAVRTYKWTFGDGEYSTAKDAFHQYNSNGLFDVTLEVWDSVSSKKITKQNLIGIDTTQFKIVDLKFQREWRYFSSSSGSANDYLEESKENSLTQVYVGESGCIKTNLRLDGRWTRTVSYGGSSSRDDRRYLNQSIFEIDSDKILNRVNSNYGCITGVDLTSKQILSFSLVPTNEFIAQQSFYPFGSNPNCPVQDQFKDKIFLWTDTTVQEKKPLAFIRHRFKNWKISDSTSFFVFHEYLTSPIDSSNWCLYNGSTQLLQQRVLGNSFPVYSDASSVGLINFSPIKVSSDESWFDRVAISNVGSVIDSVRTPCVGNFTPQSFISVNGNDLLFIGTNTKDSCGEIRIIDKENKIRYRQVKHYTSLDHIARLDDSTYSISGTLKNRTTGLCVYRLSDSIVREYRFNPDVFGAASLTNHGKTFLAVSSGGGDVFFYKGENPDVDSLLLGVEGQNQEEESSNLQVRLLPNPADELVHITCNKPNSTVIVTDVLGKEHYRESTSNTITFDLHSFQSGMYFITAIHNGISTTVPLAVHH